MPTGAGTEMRKATERMVCMTAPRSTASVPAGEDRVAGLEGNRVRTTIQIALCVLCLGFLHGTAIADGFCAEGVEAKIDRLHSTLATLRSAIPAVPPASGDYFIAEYQAAVDSKSSARLEAIERQPYFNEWMFLKAVGTVDGAIQLLRESTNPDRIHQFKSIPQERIFWATGALSALVSVEGKLGEYLDRQSRLSHPMVAGDKVFWLRTIPGGAALDLSNIIECELGRVSSTVGPALHTYQWK
jgi:hypothetical protein